MQIRIDGSGEYDRHEGEVRFVATVDDQRTCITIMNQALFLIGEARGMPPSEPLVIYAASGKLLKLIVADVVKKSGDAQSTYLVGPSDVLRVTGSEPGLPHVPKRWKV